MKPSRWATVLVVSLLGLSVLSYVLHYAIYRDSEHIFKFLLGDLAFVFVEVLLVTLVIHRILEQRERRARMEKLNMVIGTFFSEVGTDLLRALGDLDPQLHRIRDDLLVREGWSAGDFERAQAALRRFDYRAEPQRVDWRELGDFLAGKRDFLLRLLDNPTLLEHESFTDLLRAVFHLNEELAAREELTGLPAPDYEHLAGDIGRVFGELVSRWLHYMAHLQACYPFLFSLALRTSPLDPGASPVVRAPA